MIVNGVSVYAVCCHCDRPAVAWIDGITPVCHEHDDPDLTDDGEADR